MEGNRSTNDKKDVNYVNYNLRKYVNYNRLKSLNSNLCHYPRTVEFAAKFMKAITPLIVTWAPCLKILIIDNKFMKLLINVIIIDYYLERCNPVKH